MKQITEYTDVELKALAFEQIQQMELAQNKLKAINQELANRAKRETPRETSYTPQGEELPAETTKDTTKE